MGMNTMIQRIKSEYGEVIVAPTNAGKSRTMLLDAIEYAKEGRNVFYITDEASVERTIEHMSHIYDGDFDREVLPLNIELMSVEYGQGIHVIEKIVQSYNDITESDKPNIVIMYDCPARALYDLHEIEKLVDGTNIMLNATIQSKRPRGYDLED